MVIDVAELDEVLKGGILQALKQQLASSYASPLEKPIKEAVAKLTGSLTQLIHDGIEACVNDQVFRDRFIAEMQTALAKTLVRRFGGELERQVNVLKSDPATRARITLAIEEIVKQKSA